MEGAGASYASGIERVLSVDNIVGGLFRLGQAANGSAGFGRTDSEAAFQEFLKRIPSASNLAAIAGSAGALDAAAFPPSSASLLMGPASASALPELAAAAAATTGGGFSGAGIPRVSSIDFLARIVTQQQAAPTSAGATAPSNTPGYAATTLTGLKVEPVAAGAPGGPLAMGLGSPDFHAALAAGQAAAGLPLSHPLAPHLGTNPAAAAAAALQLQGQLGPHLNRLAGGTTSKVGAGDTLHRTTHREAPSSHTGQHMSATSHSDDEGNNVHKDENRRQRRMLSNRESARRSRKRKQEHLSKLENELSAAQEERRTALEKASSLERRCTSVEEENRRLREENERLRDELRFLRSELSDRKNGWRREAPLEQDDSPPASKRAHMTNGHHNTARVR